MESMETERKKECLALLYLRVVITNIGGESLFPVNGGTRKGPKNINKIDRKVSTCIAHTLLKKSIEFPNTFLLSMNGGHNLGKK
jgi:hypothetical protein